MTALRTRCTQCGHEEFSEPIAVRDHDSGSYIPEGVPIAGYQYADGAWATCCSEHPQEEALASFRLAEPFLTYVEGVPR